MTLTKTQKNQIRKFGFYGLLKNLRFFDPFILIYFLSFEISLFQIGLLFSIKEIIIYVFEIPSGVIADRYGKKNELYVCFVFYILSFIGFYIATDFYMFMIAMILFGLGEAFRSGTHKAMIMTYLEQESITTSKVKVYGLTRSYSLIGSMIASLMSIVLVLVFIDIKYLFLAAIVPYVIDVLLIMSYPNSLNEKIDHHFSFKSFVKEAFLSVGSIFKSKKVFGTLFNSASYQATFKMIKDYIQPILLNMTITVVIVSSLDRDEHQTVYLGVIYAVIYLMSAMASRYAYMIKKVGHSSIVVHLIGLIFGLLLVILSFNLNQLAIVGLVFLGLYVLTNLRKPVMVERIGEVADKDKRATVLSVESQLTSLFIIIGAPVLGYLADYNLKLMLISVGCFLSVLYGINVIIQILHHKK